jgi:hypothetical protein
MKKPATTSNILKSLIAMTVGVMLSSCASVQTVSAPSKPDAPEAGKGLVTFYRESAFVGRGVSYKITEAGQPIGGLKNGSYFVHQASPGAHIYEAKTEATESISVSVETGKSYYIQGGVSMGAFVGRPTLSLADPSTAKSALGGLKRVALKK